MLEHRNIRGYVPIIPNSPGFVTPIFEVNEVLFVQDISGKVLLGMLEVNEPVLMVRYDSSVRVAPNDIVFGFFTNSQNISFNTGEGLASYLDTLMPWLPRRPALVNSIKRFLESNPSRDKDEEKLTNKRQTSSSQNDEDQNTLTIDGVESKGDSNWTDTRVALLRKMWIEGHSASQIAANLGEGTTRNGVISKVHKLNLGGRIKPSTDREVGRRGKHSGGRSPSIQPSVSRQVLTSMGSLGTVAAQLAQLPDEELEIVFATLQELIIPLNERFDLLSLSENTCKWPIGDPLSRDFHFCGKGAVESPYCKFHSRRAYLTFEKRKR